MCDFSQGLKLCTCANTKIDALEKSKTSYWVLKRWDSEDWMDAEIGRCFYPDFSQNDLENAEFIGYYLNAENCFDFDFVPQEKDTLNFTIFRKNELPLAFEFEFLNGEWWFVDSISEHLNDKWQLYCGKIVI